MGLNFRKSIKIAPGVRVNVGKKSTSLSFGGNGLRYSISSNGKRRSTVGIPGSGLSYTTTSGGKSKQYKSQAYQQRQYLNQLKKQEKQELARFEVDQYQNSCEILKSIHIESDEPVDWHYHAQRTPLFNINEAGPREKQALYQLQNYKPGFFDKIFKSNKKEVLENGVLQARKEDQEEYNDWVKLTRLSERVLAGDLDAYMEVIEEMDPLEDLHEFGSGFEIGCNNASTLYVTFDVYSQTIIPKNEKTLTQAGNLSIKKLTKTKYFDLQQDYVCSCTIRIARDMFALLPVQTVYVHAYDEQLNTETGHVERFCVLSVKFDRATLESLNIGLIDPSDALNNFHHNMKFRKTMGFAEVEEIV
ncbi:DUF4236 domain-containing protein [Ureibacillus chungkukjangi]|uniref:Uncharacterized protein DUF4236 n=1 Tax=Ureibacillus chungkukjangi TaxID=1202712 RepID=A0A318TQY0_9BACL|nr:DUF4236 domain-containing protein [Ureibacillus chungkukjangi]PYF04305.1 uncharacterized protein DUF4236 [Ureibacillus chungkukjangi]